MNVDCCTFLGLISRHTLQSVPGRHLGALPLKMRIWKFESIRSARNIACFINHGAGIRTVGHVAQTVGLKGLLPATAGMVVLLGWIRTRTIRSVPIPSNMTKHGRRHHRWRPEPSSVGFAPKEFRDMRERCSSMSG